jgi:hypothetical protein
MIDWSQVPDEKLLEPSPFPRLLLPGEYEAIKGALRRDKERWLKELHELLHGSGCAVASD